MSVNYRYGFCPRCGKKMITTKSYKETIGNSVVTFTEKACSDSECQKEFEKAQALEKLARDRIKTEKAKKEEERLILRQKLRNQKTH